MAVNDLVADMLTRMRNALQVGKTRVRVCASKLNSAILDVLKSEGYILDYRWIDIRTNIKMLEVDLKYYNGQSVIRVLKRVSRLGQRVYIKKDAPPVFNGLGIRIVSTPKGVMTHTKAKQANTSGEELCVAF